MPQVQAGTSGRNNPSSSVVPPTRSLNIEGKQSRPKHRGPPPLSVQPLTMTPMSRLRLILATRVRARGLKRGPHEQTNGVTEICTSRTIRLRSVTGHIARPTAVHKRLQKDCNYCERVMGGSRRHTAFASTWYLILATIRNLPAFT
jgi:hypothetical protein